MEKAKIILSLLALVLVSIACIMFGVWLGNTQQAKKQEKAIKELSIVIPRKPSAFELEVSRCPNSHEGRLQVYLDCHEAAMYRRDM